MQKSGFKEVKKKLRKSDKKRVAKVWKSGKRCYFCTRIEGQVHTHNEVSRSDFGSFVKAEGRRKKVKKYLRNLNKGCKFALPNTNERGFIETQELQLLSFENKIKFFFKKAC